METPLSSCSPPSTPQPERHQSSLQPNTSTLVPYSSHSASGPVPPTTEIGSLDLKPCSVDEYLDIDASVYGKYEYIEGILVALPMADDNHDNIIKYLQNHATVRYVRGQTKYPPASQEGLAIPNPHSSPGNPSPRRTIRRPDLSTASRLSPSQRSQLSPKSRRISNPLAGQVKSVVEVTSRNERTDTEIKPLEYDKAGVGMFAIVNRDATCEDESKRDQRIEVFRRDSTSNSWGPKEVYRDDTPVDLGPFGTHRPATLFGKPEPTCALDELAQEMKESKKREEILRDKVEAVESKKRHYKKLVRKNIPDEEVSTSSGSPSSKTNSPNRKRVKGRINHE